VARLWYIGWLSRDRANRLSLSQGRLWIWVGQKDDFTAFTPGFDAGGWSGGAIEWSPEFEPNQRMYVPSAPPAPNTPPGATIMAKAIYGLSITIPMWIPLGLTIIPTLLIPVAVRVRARRRAARGQCRACGYDRAGVPGPCPECGTLLRRLCRWIREHTLTPLAPLTRHAGWER
jgi:hypothetical protein